MRCTMGESRLSSLAIMHIKYDMPIDLDELKAPTSGWQLQSLPHETECCCELIITVAHVVAPVHPIVT